MAEIFIKDLLANATVMVPTAAAAGYFIKKWINGTGNKISNIEEKMVDLPLHKSEMDSHMERIYAAEAKANSAVPREVCNAVQERVMSMLESIKEDVTEIKERIR